MYVLFMGKNMAKKILNPIYEAFMQEWRKMKPFYRLEHHREFSSLYTWFKKGYKKNEPINPYAGYDDKRLK